MGQGAYEKGCPGITFYGKDRVIFGRGVHVHVVYIVPCSTYSNIFGTPHTNNNKKFSILII